jgi:hypothetical protein
MAGRIVISAFVVVTLLAVLTANLPASRLQSLLLDAGHRYIYATGLDENWGVFAPDPRRETVHVWATVTYADGSKAKWEVRRRDPVIGSYVDYRWLKWAEYVVSPANQEPLWHPFALFVARRLASPTHRPVKVEVSNRWYDLEPPGVDQPRFVQQRVFYTTPISGKELEGTGS